MPHQLTSQHISTEPQRRLSATNNVLRYPTGAPQAHHTSAPQGTPRQCSTIYVAAHNSLVQRTCTRGSRARAVVAQGARWLPPNTSPPPLSTHI